MEEAASKLPPANVFDDRPSVPAIMLLTTRPLRNGVDMTLQIPLWTARYARAGVGIEANVAEKPLRRLELSVEYDALLLPLTASVDDGC